MISFDLICSGAHVFEAWFRSSADYADQQQRGLIACPMCGDTAIAKAVMAPNIGAKGNRVTAQPAVPSAEHRAEVMSAAPDAATPSAPSAPAMMAAPALANLPPQAIAILSAIAQAQAESLPRSRWVGKRFAEEARALHAAQERGDETAADALIHGQATAEEAESLRDAGIGVMPLLVPVVPPELQN